MDTNKTVLTDEEIRALFPFSEKVGAATIDVARAVESAVLDKLPGMPAKEWLKEHERLARAFGHAEYDHGYADGDGEQDLKASWGRSDDALGALLSHARQRIESAASEAVIDTCEEGGHKFAKLADHPTRDGRPRCPHCMAIGLDRLRAASEAGAVPVAVKQLAKWLTLAESARDCGVDVKDYQGNPTPNAGFWREACREMLAACNAAPPSAPAAESAEPCQHDIQKVGDGSIRCVNCGSGAGAIAATADAQLSGNSGELTQQPSGNSGELDVRGDERALNVYEMLTLLDTMRRRPFGAGSRREDVLAFADDVQRAALSRQPSAAAENDSSDVPAAVWESLQRMIEDGFQKGQAGREDARIVARFRRSVLMGKPSAAASVQFPDKPLKVFAAGTWTWGGDGSRHSAEDLNNEAFVRYRAALAAAKPEGGDHE